MVITSPQFSSSIGSSPFWLLLQMTHSPTYSSCKNHDLHHPPHHNNHDNEITTNEDNLHDKTNDTKFKTNPQNQQIPVEIVSEEEMAFIEAAMSLSRSSAVPSPHFSLLCSHSRSIDSIGLVSKRTLRSVAGSESSVCDVEDSGRFKSARKKTKVPDSLLSRFRRKKGLSVTDITATEWCDKQIEYFLLFGKPEITNAMKAGISRHAKLEEEVMKKVEVRVESLEDIWALKFMNFISCTNQLLFDGLTRELPVVGFVQGAWVVGVIDELRIPVIGDSKNVILVDTKTRVQPRLPAEPQRRNGRLQLMCYKHLWDKLISDDFPSEQFYDFFSLDPQHVLSDELKTSTADSGFPAQTLGEVVRYFGNACSMLPRAHDKLLLRYELQKDNSLIGEDEFTYDTDWLKAQIHNCLEFWKGEREAKYVPVEERWKCRFCQFASVCPSQ